MWRWSGEGSKAGRCSRLEIGGAVYGLIKCVGSASSYH